MIQQQPQQHILLLRLLRSCCFFRLRRFVRRPLFCSSRGEGTEPKGTLPRAVSSTKIGSWFDVWGAYREYAGGGIGGEVRCCLGG